MRKTLRKLVSLVGQLGPYTVAVASLFVIGFYSWETRPFVGDDLEVFNAIDSGAFLNNWSEILRDTSLDKWRPVNNLFLFLAVNLFGNSYVAFWFINTFLIFMIPSPSRCRHG